MRKNMERQIIISIGREFGSGGHEIAQKLSEIYRLPLYDHTLLDEIAKKTNLENHELRALDETKRNKLFSRTVKGMNNSAAHNLALLQFDFLKKKADAGESFIVVGRCSETILKENEGLISFFILGDKEVKIKRIMELYGLSEIEAQAMMYDKDRRRKQYHNSFCPGKWGDSRNYELSINSSKLGLEETVKIICAYIDSRIGKNQ